MRLSKLRGLLPSVPKKVLMQQLRELETDGLVHRTDLSGTAPHVQYALSKPYGQAVLDMIFDLAVWGFKFAQMDETENGPEVE